MELKIYSQNGTLKMTVSPSDSSTHVHELMGENVVNASFTSPEYVSLDVNDYLELEGSPYKLHTAYEPRQKSTQEYTYNIKFYGRESEVKRALMLYLTDGELEPKFSYEGSPRDHVQKVVDSLNYMEGGNRWVTGTVIDAPNLSLDYNNMFCDQALTELAGKLETEWWIEGYTVNLCRCEFGETVELGYLHGLINLQRSENNTDVRFFTRLIPLGSTKNIDKGLYGFKRLQLPGRERYVDKDTDRYGVYPQVEEAAFEGIFPRRTGTLSEVRSEERTGENGKYVVWYFKDSGMDFDPNEYDLPGLVKHAVFKSGNLQGRDFEINFDSGKKEFEIITQYPDEESQLPGGNLIPASGDTYILYNLRMPDEYYAPAEAEYKAAVDAFLAKYSTDTAIYRGDTDYVHILEHGIILSVGRRVRLLSDNYFKETGHRDSRITKVTRKLNNLSQATIECTNAVGKGRMEVIESDVDSIKKMLDSQTDDLILSILRSWDSGDITDYKVFSALRTVKEILNRAISRVNDDTAAGVITFLKGLFIGNFSEGPLGSGACVKIDPITGKSYIEVDELFVRMKAYFTELIIATLRHVGGNYILTPASMKCIKVEELADVYRCYFKKTDGDRTIHNEFVAGDQATIREFNIEPGVHENIGNRYYWRLVTAIGDDYIDLSKTDCDTNSDAPEAGDDICQLGNRNDRSRMNAIILSSYGDDAPSSKQYAGIDSYSLEGKEVTVESPSGNRYVGDFVLETGISIATQLKVLENLIKTEIQNVEYWINDSDNYLTNASFSLNLENWQRESDLQVLTAEQPLVVNSEYYADATKIAEVVNHGDKFMLRIKNSFVKQLNSDLDHPEKSGKFYVSFRYICEGSGTLTCGFEGQELYKAAPIAINRQFRIFEFSGDWDGSGDFLLRFTGDIYINLLTLTNRPLDDFRKEVSSKFEQTSSSITAAVKAIDNINKTIRESGWLTTQDGTKIWASAQWPDGTKALSLFDVTPEGIFLDGSHINLKGLVTFESFSADFQTAYNQAFGNASMTAKDDVARQLGYNNYSQLVENAATNGKAIMIGGYLNLELIDVDTLLANKVFSNKVVTSLAGKRIEIDPAKNAIVMYNQGEEKVAELYFFDEEGYDYSQGYLQLISYRSNKEVGKAVIGAHSIGLMLSDGGVVNLSERGVEVNRLIGNNWKTLSVGLYPLMTGGTVSDYITNISSNSWPTKDNALPNSIYVENGILKVK
ncbi:hypothetical protein ACIXR3_14135 [Bacteroides fragilis]